MVAVAVAVANLAFGLLPRDLSPGRGHLDRHRDRADHERGDH